MSFDTDYVKFDDLGPVEVRCMACNTPIQSRAEVPSKLAPGTNVYHQMKHANFTEIPVICSDGSFSFLMVCRDCKDIEITDEIAGKVSDQIYRGTEMQVKHDKPSDVVAELLLQRSKNRKVLRRAETAEVSRLLGV